MEWLNYHHLLYFWTVVREGGVSRAAEKLRLAQPTISAQVKLLEDTLGDKLFERQGRRLVLTDVGRLVYRYADEIFGIGRELLETLKGRPPAGRPLPLTVGVANAVPKLIVHRLLQPAMSGDQPIRLVCREDSTETLLGELATHALDVVIADVPGAAARPGQGLQPPARRVGHDLLRRRPAGREAAPPLSALAERCARCCCRRPTPPCGARSISGSRPRIIHPRVVGEFDDSALMKTFGQAGHAAFPAPSAIEHEVVRQYRVHAVGRVARRPRTLLRHLGRAPPQTSGRAGNDDRREDDVFAYTPGSLPLRGRRTCGMPKHRY